MASGVLMASDGQQQQQQQQEPMFHDFLGMCCSDSSAMMPADSKTVAGHPPEAYSGAAPLHAGSSSDVASLEGKGGSNFQRGQFHGHMGNFSVLDRYSGRKRGNSDSAFMGSVRSRMLPVAADAFENARLMKIYQNDARGDRLVRQHQEEFSNLMQPPRTVSAVSSLSQLPMSMRDIVASKLDRMDPAGTNTMPAMSFDPRLNQYGQYGSFADKIASNVYGDNSAGPSLLAQPAADEGSRTGMKGSGNAAVVASTTGSADKSPKGIMPSGGRPKPESHTSEIDSLCPSSHQILPSVNHQMTIFYAGQAHVFDDVHPKKADAIMALAGSNGLSWSTTYSSKSSRSALSSEASKMVSDNEVGARKVLSQDRQGAVPSTTCTSIEGGQNPSLPPAVVMPGTQGCQSEKDTKLVMLKGANPENEDSKEVT